MTKLFFLSLLLLFSVGVNAVTLKSMYDVTVVVESQTDKVRNRAIDEAFAELLIKVTGAPDITQSESAKALISKSRNYVRSFRYQTLASEENINPVVKLWPAVAVEPPSTQSPAQELQKSVKQQLVVSFDEAAVGNALWQAKLPVWGSTRPTTLLWVAYQDSEKRGLLTAADQTELHVYLNQQAKKRGLPILYPALDPQDQQVINVNDVWNGFNEPLELASMRYTTEAIASVSLSLQPDNHWEARWSLIQSGEAENWNLSSPDIKLAMEQGMNELATRVARRYVTIAATADDSMLVTITDVNNIHDYNRINVYLNGLAPVKKAELMQVQANQVVFKLDLRSNAKQLKQSIALGTTLASDDPSGIDSQSARMSYRLLP